MKCFLSVVFPSTLLFKGMNIMLHLLNSYYVMLRVQESKHASLTHDFYAMFCMINFPALTFLWFKNEN